MIDHNRIVIGCVAASSNKNNSYLETEYLFRTLNRFGGEASKVNKWACFVEKPNPIVKDVLKELGVIIKIIKPLDERDPYSNKLRLLEKTINEDVDYLIVLDTDIIIAEDFSSFIHGDSIKAKPANLDLLRLENWKILFEHFNLKLPINRIKTIITKEETIPYFSSGVIIIPKKYVKILFETWSNFIHTLCDHREKEELPKILPDFQRANEMVALALTLAKTGFNCSPLPLKMNYSTLKVNPEENPSKLKPLLIHHHHRILEDGVIKPSPYENINKIIDQINEFLKKERRLEVTSSTILSHITRNLLNEGNYYEVIKRLKDLPIDHYDSVLHFHLAKAYQETENYTKSLMRYSASLKKGYHTPINIYLNRGSFYLKMDQLTNAENELKKAFELNPSDKRIINRLSILEKRINSHENREKLKKKSKN